jgi:uncharacterized protein with PQ loop repeat
MLTKEFWVETISWMVRSLFWVGLIPQLFLNYKHRTTRGISGFMLFGYFTGYLASTFYVFCLKLPIQYKVMIPLSLLTASVLVFQRLYYDKCYKALVFYLAGMVGAIAILPLAFKYTAEVGHFFGWMAVFLWATYQIPQVFKIYFSKSVIGFSFFLVTAIGIGNIIEGALSIINDLPDQSVVSGVRGGIIYMVFCIQFLLYRRHQKKKRAIAK